jgi:predicted nucleotidyltransferase
MIDLEEKHLAEIRKILSVHVPGCEVRVFGSRVNGRAAKFSDVDLAIVCNEKLDRRKIELLKDAFAASDLPISVDVVDWHSLSDGFRQLIEKKYEVLQM